MSENYKYPLKVWLSSVISGTLISFTWKYFNARTLDLVPLDFWLTHIWLNLFFAITIAVIYSLPCWLILWYVYERLLRSTKESILMKWVLSLLSQTLCWMLFTLLFMTDGGITKSDLTSIIPYALSLACFILYYLPRGNNLAQLAG